ncbi:MAG: hypothetical protein ACI88A_001755 [Paraglaciecola sp.]|jgi:hypothetical protein
MTKYFRIPATLWIKCIWLMLVTLTVQVEASNLQSYEAKFTAFRYGRDLGNAELSLQALGRNKYRLTYDSKISLFFLSDIRHEVSLFSFSNETIIPYKYEYKRTGTGPNKAITVLFDSNKKQIKVNDEAPISWQQQLDNQLYRLDIQYKLAQGATEFSYDVINNRGELKQYDLKVLGKEQLDLPYGVLEGIKVNIIRTNSTRQTYAWFSPQLNYQLVRLQQFKDGDEQGEIQLKEYTVK